MHLIFMVHSSNPDYNADCDYAVVELTPALVEQIRSRAVLVRRAAKQDSQLDEICFWDSTVNFYGSSLANACQDRKPSAAEPNTGTITSNLKRDTTAEEAEYIAAIDGLESLILAHACAGIDVTTPAYIEGIETTVEAIANHHGV